MNTNNFFAVVILAILILPSQGFAYEREEVKKNESH